MLSRRRPFLLLLTLFALLPAAAAADPPSAPDPGAWVPDGYTSAVAHAGTTTYVGGYSRYWGPYTGAAAAIRLPGGAADPTFPRISGGSVLAAIPDTAGGAYLAGTFTKVDGEPAAGVVHIGPGGNLVTDFSVSIDDGIVHALALAPDGTLYLGGSFTQVDGQDHGRLVAVNALSGALKPFPGCVDDNSPSSAGSDRGTVFALAVSGSTLFVGGNLTNAGTEVTGCGYIGRQHAAAFSTSTGAPTTWQPEPSDTVRALLTDGTTVWLGGSFGSIGSPGVARESLAAVSATGTASTPTSWDPNARGYVNALLPGPDGELYAGGEFDTIGSNALARGAVALLSTAGTGPALTSFDAGLRKLPQGQLGVDAMTFAGSPGNLVLGGIFRAPKGPVEDLTSVDPATGRANAASVAPQPGGEVRAVAAAFGGIVVGGHFQSIGAQVHPYLVALDAAGHPRPGFKPDLPTYPTSIVPSPDGKTLWLLGGFPGTSLLAVDATTGASRPVPDIGQGLYAIAFSPDGKTLYLGGGFDEVEGRAQLGAAAFRTSDLSLLPWAPDPDGAVFAIATHGDAVYLGGSFAHIGASVVSRANLAEVSAATGDVSPWNPKPDDQVESLALAPDGAHIYVSGTFGTIGTEPQSRSGAAELTLGSGNPTAFDPAPSHDVEQLLPTADGTEVYVSGSFDTLRYNTAPGVAVVHSATGYDPGWLSGYGHNYGYGVVAADGDTAWAGMTATTQDGRAGYLQFTTAPKAAAPPALSTAPVAGTTVACKPALWRNAPASLAASWELDGAPIPGAAHSTFTPTKAQAGHALRCVVKATNPAGSATAVSPAKAVAAAPVGPTGASGPTSPGGTTTSTTSPSGPTSSGSTTTPPPSGPTSSGSTTTPPPSGPASTTTPPPGGPASTTTKPPLGPTSTSTVTSIPGSLPTVTDEPPTVPPGPPPPPATLTAAHLSKRRFAARRRKHGGTTLSLTLSGPTTVTASITRATPGVRKAGSGACVAGHPGHGRRACVRQRAAGTLGLGALPAGTTRVPLTGLANGHRLRPGRYVLTLGVADSTAKRTLSFVIRGRAGGTL